MGRLEDVVEATEKLETALHEGRATLKDMYQERKRLEKATEEARTVVVDIADEEIEQIIDERVQYHMGELTEVVDETKNKLHDNLIASFDEIANTLMYGKKNPRTGQMSSLAELMESKGLVYFEKRAKE